MTHTSSAPSSPAHDSVGQRDDRALSTPVAGATGGGAFTGFSGALGHAAANGASAGMAAAADGGIHTQPHAEVHTSASTLAPAPSQTGPVAEHGALHVAGKHIVDSAGRPIQLRGMSLFWSQWSDFYLPSTVDQLADEWHASLVRAALGVEPEGYLESAAENEAKVIAVVNRAIERGIYVIIDWHDHHAPEHEAAALEFFSRMATKYATSNAVIFEVFNEPLQVEWSSVKSYAQKVISAIREAGATNLVLVGTPNWSQDVDAVIDSPITDQQDVAYTLHFYAATHKQWLRDKAQKAIDAGLPLFVSEWGTCEATGDGIVDQAETQLWLDFLAEHHLSWANWSLHDKAEACSALVPGAGTRGPWTDAALSDSGAWVRARIPSAATGTRAR